MSVVRRLRAISAMLCLGASACKGPPPPPPPAVPEGMSLTPMADDRDAARLCGYLASRPETPMRFPWPADHGPADTTVTPRLLAYVDGPEVRGVRVVVPAADSGGGTRYVFRGVTRDGHRRVFFERPVPALAAPAAVIAAEGRAPAALLALDSVAATVRLPAGDSSGVLPSMWPDTLAEPDRAVPDLHRLPESRITLDGACPIVTLGTQALPRVERILRVDVPAGRTLLVRARGSTHGLVLGLDAPSTPDSARTRVRWTAEDSMRVAEARQVTVRLRTVPKPRDRETSSFVLVTLRLR